SGLAMQKSRTERMAYEVKALIESGENMAGIDSGSNAAAGSAALAAPLWRMLIYAFIGGLILYVMPCVLPVIALKILGFVAQAKEDAYRARQLGLIYAAGVLVSFLVLALLVIGIKAAGHRAGWGIQFGNPYFLVIMTTLATLIALNLFG